MHLVPLDKFRLLLVREIVLDLPHPSVPTPLPPSITSPKVVSFSNSSCQGKHPFHVPCRLKAYRFPQAMPHALTSRIRLSIDSRHPRGPLLPSRLSDHLSIQTLVRIMSPNSSPLKIQRLSKVLCQWGNPGRKGLHSQTRPCLTLFRPSMLSPRPRLPLASLPRHPLTSKGRLSHSRTIGRRWPSTLSASPWTIFSSKLAIPKHQFHRRLNHCPLSISILMTCL